jgi:hypothetical protein
MGIDIGGAIIIKNAGDGISLNSLVFNSLGQGAANSIPGYMGYKSGATLYYSGVSGWEINAVNWQSGLNTTNGVFTCPVAGLYAMGYNGLHNGGGGIPAGFNTYGYSAFARNGAMSYHTHWNGATVAGNTAWNSSGTSALFVCAAGDTLALFINRAPSPVGPDSVAKNYGVHPDGYSPTWCKLVG